MNAYEIGNTPAFPYGAPATAPFSLPSIDLTAWPGTKGSRCALKPMVPIPGPPPPCGIAKVLCKLRWPTSAPINPGDVNPS